MPDRLDQERFADAGWTQQQHIGFLTDEMTGRQIVDLLAFDRRVEGEVELVKVFDLAEQGGFDAAANLPAGAYVQLVLKDQFQELGVIEPVAARLAEANLQALGQAREPKLSKRLQQ